MKKRLKCLPEDKLLVLGRLDGSLFHWSESSLKCELIVWISK